MTTTLINVKGRGYPSGLLASPDFAYIGRGTKWGNPYVTGRDGTRTQVIGMYRAYIMQRPDLLEALPELLGKTLGCWCVPLPCHGNVLLQLLERITPPCEIQSAFPE